MPYESPGQFRIWRDEKGLDNGPESGPDVIIDVLSSVLILLSDID